MIFRYYDMRAEAALPVFQSTNVATAIRDTKDLLIQGRLNRVHASDFALYQVGTTDDPNLRIEHLQDPKHILDLVEIIREIEDTDGN